MKPIDVELVKQAQRYVLHNYTEMVALSRISEWWEMAFAAQAKELAEAKASVEKLQAFKDWTHAYLDAQGVPVDPGGPHSECGCRIGDRMDWWRDRLAEAKAANERLHIALNFATKNWTFDGDPDATANTMLMWEKWRPLVDAARG